MAQQHPTDCTRATWEGIQQAQDIEQIAVHLLSCYRLKLRGFIVKTLNSQLIGKDQNYIDDIEQHTWITATQKIIDSMEDGKPGFIWENAEKDMLFFWLCGIARHHIYNLAKKLKRRNQNELLFEDFTDVPQDYLLIDEILNLTNTNANERPLENDVLFIELVAVIEDILTDLNPRHQEIFAAYVFGFMSSSEIGRQFGITKSTVRQTVSRIRDTLRHQLAEYVEVKKLFRTQSRDIKRDK